MSVYLIAATQDKPELAAAIARVFPNDYMTLSGSQWAVSANVTANAIGASLDANEGRYGRFIIVPLSNYWGWHDKELWNWIALKSGK